MKRPAGRKSFTYRIYCDLVCGLKLHHAKKVVFPMVSDERGVSVKHVERVYDRYVRSNLAAGMLIKELF
jgi:hypothetical protein